MALTDIVFDNGDKFEGLVDRTDQIPLDIIYSSPMVCEIPGSIKEIVYTFN